MKDFQLDLIISGAGEARSRSSTWRSSRWSARPPSSRSAARRHSGTVIPTPRRNSSRSSIGAARVLGVSITADGANEIARRARTPRIAGRLLRRVRDSLPSAPQPSIAWLSAALDAAPRHGPALPDDHCLELWRRSRWRRDPAALSEPRDAIEGVVETLLSSAVVQRTRRSRPNRPRLPPPRSAGEPQSPRSSTCSDERTPRAIVLIKSIALHFRWSMIFPENQPSTFPDHAQAPAGSRRSFQVAHTTEARGTTAELPTAAEAPTFSMILFFGVAAVPAFGPIWSNITSARAAGSSNHTDEVFAQRLSGVRQSAWLFPPSILLQRPGPRNGTP